MDEITLKKIQETISKIRSMTDENIDYNKMDPIAKMMLVALMGEVQNIRDQADLSEQHILERFCSHFIPYEQVGAVPAIALLHPQFKNPEVGVVSIGSGAVFTARAGERRVTLNFIPLFCTTLLSYADIYVVTADSLSYGQSSRRIDMKIPKNEMWVGINTPAEIIDTLQGLSLFIQGTNGVQPEHIYVGSDHKRLDFSTMTEFENIEMPEPFDAQQSSTELFAFMRVWKRCLLNMMGGSLLYITDTTTDRDLFKYRAYPRAFKWLEVETLGLFKTNTLWLKVVFPQGYAIPEQCRVLANVVPVVNVDVNSQTLSPSAPIAKLQKQDNSFFLRVLQTSTLSAKQGYSPVSEEILVRDFEAACYNNADLQRDVRHLYRRFVDDYHAFAAYNGIRDGEVLKQLRQAINKIDKSAMAKPVKDQFNSGVYAMKKMTQDSLSTTTKVSYITTFGHLGNEVVDTDMANRKVPAVKMEVPILVHPMGGADRAPADARYELLRYYSLTRDRLYTKMDVDAFLRKEVMIMFGQEEFRRIFIKIQIGGAGGSIFLQRGLYIDIEFKDKKNYDKAVGCSFDLLMKQKIEEISCIAMPIVVSLIDLEK